MRRGETFSFNGGIVSVPAGAGFNGVQPTVLVSGVAASGTRVVIDSVIAHILNIGSDQITLTLRRNGAPALSGFMNLPASFFDSYPSLEVHEEFAPGTFDIVATNKSGTTQPGAVAAVAADCQASFLGYQLSPQQPQVQSFWKRILAPWCVAAITLIMGVIPVYAQVQVTPGVTTARSAQPIACVNPTTFVLEACGGASALQNVNLTQVGSTNVVTGGVAGTLAIGGTSNNNSAISQNPVLVGCESFNLSGGTQPVAATVANLRRMLCSEEGSLVVTPYGANRFSCFVEAVTVTTQCQAAPGAGLRVYVTGFVASNQAATVQSLDLVQGTGANCVTALTARTHKHQMGTVATTTSPFLVSVTYPNPVILSTASALCVRPSAATAFGATLTGYIAP